MNSSAKREYEKLNDMREQIKTTVFLLLGLGIFAYLFRQWDVDLVLAVKSIKNYWLIALAVTITPLPLLVAALRMKYFLHTLEKGTFSTYSLFKIEAISKFIFNVMPFKLNVPLKAILLRNMVGAQLANGAAVVMFEYALDTGITVFFGLLGVFLFFKNLPSISFINVDGFIILMAAASATFFLTPVSFFDALAHRIESVRPNIIKKILTFMMKLLRSMRVTWVILLTDRKMYRVAFFTGALWLTAIIMSELLFMSVNYNIPFLWIAAVVSAGLFVGGVSTIPGGIGVREATMVFLYHSLGVPQEISIVVVILNRLLSFIPMGIGYLMARNIGISVFKKDFFKATNLI